MPTTVIHEAFNSSRRYKPRILNNRMEELLCCFLKVQVSLLLGATGKAEIKIESEDTFLNLSYFYNLTQLYQSAVIMQGESLKKRKSPTHVRTSNVIFTFNIITYLEVVSGG